MAKAGQWYIELTENGRLEKDDEILDKAYQDHLDQIPKDFPMRDRKEKWWEPLDRDMATKNPPYEDK